MLFGFCPYNDRTIQLLLEKIKKCPLEIPSHVQNISQKTENLLRGMLTVSPKKRIEWVDLLNYYEKKER